MRPIDAADERFHPVDPDDRVWNESWFFSWIDLDGGPCGFFRVGLMPTQGRAMLWMFVYADGRWIGREESRLAFDDFDLGEGIAYDRWGLRFAWRPDPPLDGARFSFEGSLLERAEAGAHVPTTIELDCRATAAPMPTPGGGDGTRAIEAHRFEQPLTATGRVVMSGAEHAVRAGAHRDKSWGPREWRVRFTVGDVQADDRQLYFVGQFPGFGMAFVREGDTPVTHLAVLGDTTVDFDDAGRTIHGASLHVAGDQDLVVPLRTIAPSVVFDIGHTCEEPEHWLYYRTLVEANVPGWPDPARGWFETNRYGADAHS